MQDIRIHKIIWKKPLELPYVQGSGLHCGFPSPALDYTKKPIDLNELLISHPSATIVASVFGDSMKDAGIMDPAHLVIDRAEKLVNNDIVVVVVDGDFKVRRYTKDKEGVVTFYSENKEKQHLYPPLKLNDGHDVELWGVVTKIILDPRVVYANSRI